MITSLLIIKMSTFLIPICCIPDKQWTSGFSVLFPERFRFEIGVIDVEDVDG
jgi:hypothetical protein